MHPVANPPGKLVGNGAAVAQGRQLQHKGADRKTARYPDEAN